MEWKIGSLFIEYAAKTEKYSASLKDSERMARETADQIKKAATFEVPAPVRAGNNTLGLDATADQASQVGAQIGASLAAGLAPLRSIGATIAGQLNQVGGTITTLARRIDAKLKFPAFEKTLDFIESKFTGSFARGSVGAIRALKSVQDFVSHFGDVAGKSLDRLGLGGSASLAKLANPAYVASRAVRSIAPAANQASTALKSMGSQAALAFGFVGVAYGAVTAIKRAISGAANLNETLSKTGEVFGASTAQVTAQADQLAKRFGLVKGTMLDAASSIGLIAKGAGYTDKNAANLANTLSKLAADASSLYNVTLDVALEKIRAGLVGEAEPLRAFGVLLSETAVQNEALRMGLVKKAKDLDEQSKVIARAAIIERGLATASGDLERTQNSAANQFRKFAGTMENLATTIGTALMPAVSEAIAGLNEFAVAVSGAVEQSGSGFGAFVESLRQGFATVRELFGNFSGYWNIAVLKTTEAVANLTIIWDTIPANLQIIGNYVASNWVKFFVDAGNAIQAVFLNLATNIGEFANAVFQYLKDPLAGFQFNWTPLLDGFKATADQLPKLLTPNLISMQDEIDAAAGKMQDAAGKRAAQAANPQKGAARKAVDLPAGKPAAEFKREFSDLAEFSRKLSAGANREDQAPGRPSTS